jgi:hypothetical protein
MDFKVKHPFAGKVELLMTINPGFCIIYYYRGNIFWADYKGDYCLISE